MTVRLIAMTIEEVGAQLDNSACRVVRSITVAPGAEVPSVVLESALRRLHSGEHWFWCAPRLFHHADENLIIGSGCFKNSPRDGVVEIGCGVAESHRGRSLATEGVELLVGVGFSEPDVVAITAETADRNAASQRVLQKAGFARIASRLDDEDGPVIAWRRERSPA